MIVYNNNKNYQQLVVTVGVDKSDGLLESELNDAITDDNVLKYWGVVNVCGVEPENETNSDGVKPLGLPVIGVSPSVKLSMPIIPKRPFEGVLIEIPVSSVRVDFFIWESLGWTLIDDIGNELGRALLSTCWP